MAFKIKDLRYTDFLFWESPQGWHRHCSCPRGGIPPCLGETCAEGEHATLGSECDLRGVGGEGGSVIAFSGAGGGAGRKDRRVDAEGQDQGSTRLSRHCAPHEHCGHGEVGRSCSAQWHSQEFEGDGWTPVTGQCRHGCREAVEIRTRGCGKHRHRGIQVSASELDGNWSSLTRAEGAQWQT